MDTVTEFKQKLADQLKDQAGELSKKGKLQVCVELDIAPGTFERYTSGEVKHVRRLELAEAILKQIEKLQAPE